MNTNENTQNTKSEEIAPACREIIELIRNSKEPEKALQIAIEVIENFFRENADKATDGE